MVRAKFPRRTSHEPLGRRSGCRKTNVSMSHFARERRQHFHSLHRFHNEFPFGGPLALSTSVEELYRRFDGRHQVLLAPGRHRWHYHVVSGSSTTRRSSLVTLWIET